MGNREGMIYAALKRLNSRMAIGQSRRDAKQAIREASGEHLWTVSSGKIHSYTTRAVYQQHVLHFLNWVRDVHHINRLAHLDAQADELASTYLEQRMQEGRSAYTLQAERSALRLFFQDRALAEAVLLPKRTRENITRSRGPTRQDRHFQPQHWARELAFIRACGLRREELCNLFVREVYLSKKTGYLVVAVRNGKGGLPREARVLPGRERDVLSLIESRPAHEHVFVHLPKDMDIHSYRREYAQALYLYLAPGRSLPSPTGRLRPQDYDREAARAVSEQLGHQRVDVVLRHYIR